MVSRWEKDASRKVVRYEVRYRVSTNNEPRGLYLVVTHLSLFHHGGGLELRLAYQSLKTLQNAIVFEEQEPADDDREPDFAELVTDLLEMMRARLDGPQVCK